MDGSCGWGFAVAGVEQHVLEKWFILPQHWHQIAGCRMKERSAVPALLPGPGIPVSRNVHLKLLV